MILLNTWKSNKKLSLITFLIILFMFISNAYLIKKNKEYEFEMYYLEMETLERKKRVAKIREEPLSDYVQDHVPKIPEEKTPLPIVFYSFILVLDIAIISSLL